jgi:hypothetical protein
MATVYSTEEIKEDISDLTKVVREDNISSDKVCHLFKLLHNLRTDTALSTFEATLERRVTHIKDYLDQELAASDVLGRTLISRRFAEKVVSVISKYQHRPEDLKLLRYCVMLYFDKERSG